MEEYKMAKNWYNVMLCDMIWFESIKLGRGQQRRNQRRKQREKQGGKDRGQ